MVKLHDAKLRFGWYSAPGYNRYLFYSHHARGVKLLPVAAGSKAWVCGRSLAEIVGSNPARGGMDVCLL
jgi:hypothetical protein